MLIEGRNPYFSGFSLAIKCNANEVLEQQCRNPYFSGFSLAMMRIMTMYIFLMICRNPYFSGFSLAIQVNPIDSFAISSVAILILVDFPLQYVKMILLHSDVRRRNPYFSGFSLAISRLFKVIK